MKIILQETNKEPIVLDVDSSELAGNLLIKHKRKLYLFDSGSSHGVYYKHLKIKEIR
jgi:hypothetical protein